MASKHKLSRRGFLRGLAAITAAALAKTKLQGRPAQAQTGNTADVLVIGAGMAGLGAASFLQEQGYQVIVLEGRDRLGGRTWTDGALGLPLDMGASWIHGTRGNPLTDLADDLGLERAVTDSESAQAYTAEGRRFTDADWANLEESFEAVMEAAEDIREDLDEDIPLSRLIQRAISEVELSPQAQALVLFAADNYIATEYAADLEALSGFYWDSDEGFGGDEVILPGGYIQMVKALAETLDVRLNQTVEAIQWDEERAKVQAGGQTYEADYVIVTLPLGVLKRGSVTFDPPLPPEKQTAIETLGMGLLNKAYLRFPSVFWDDETWIANMAAAKTGWTDMLNLAPALGEPLLLVFNSGSLAAAAEAQSDEQIVADIMAALRAIYGPNIPDPTAHSITRWNQDPFAYGSYSFMAVGAEEDAREVLAAPLEETLFFAGEATENDHPATVHGALMSGWRAAEELIEIDG